MPQNLVNKKEEASDAKFVTPSQEKDVNNKRQSQISCFCMTYDFNATCFGLTINYNQANKAQNKLICKLHVITLLYPCICSRS